MAVFSFSILVHMVGGDADRYERSVLALHKVDSTVRTVLQAYDMSRVTLVEIVIGWNQWQVATDTASFGSKKENMDNTENTPHTLTLVEAKLLKYGTTLYHTTLRNADGTALRARVNGKVYTWKTQPERVRVPMKYGMREYFYLRANDDDKPSNLDEWMLTDPTQ